MNAQLSQQRFWYCQEKRVIKTIELVIYVSSMYVFFQVLPSLFSKEKGLSSFILIHSSENLTWNSHRGCGGMVRIIWWARSNDRAKTFTDKVGHFSWVWELWLLPKRKPGSCLIRTQYFIWLSCCRKSNGNLPVSPSTASVGVDLLRPKMFLI